jgi:hypothetical protein
VLSIDETRRGRPSCAKGSGLPLDPGARALVRRRHLMCTVYRSAVATALHHRCRGCTEEAARCPRPGPRRPDLDFHFLKIFLTLGSAIDVLGSVEIDGTHARMVLRLVLGGHHGASASRQPIIRTSEIPPLKRFGDPSIGSSVMWIST